MLYQKQETVSSSLSGGRSSTTTTTSQQQAARPISVISTQQEVAPVVRTVVAQPVQTVAVAAPARSQSQICSNCFKNLVRFTIKNIILNRLKRSSFLGLLPSNFVAKIINRQASSSVEGIFGVQGQNNVRVETPNFNFAYDLTK